MRRFMLEIGVATDIGRRRVRNEDRFEAYVPDSPSPGLAGLLMVADGMGGELGGARASQVTVERLREELVHGPYRLRPQYQEADELAEALDAAIRATSDEIYDLGQTEPELEGLGSTLVLAAFGEDQVTIANVGDSRCYLVRGGNLECLTCDHTWIGNQIEAGALTPEEARQHPQRGILIRTLGDEHSPAADIRSLAIEDGDLFLLCSDGLTGGLSDAEILELVLRFQDAQDLVEALVALANDKDGSDNITIVAGRCREDHRESRPRIEPEDTEPIQRPEGLRLSRRTRGWIWGLAGLAVALFFYVGLRLYGIHAFNQGIAFAEQGHYLPAHRQFVRAIRIGLDEKRTQQMFGVLFKMHEKSRSRSSGDPADAVPEDTVTVPP